MANILFLTQVLPYPLNSGAKIRAYYVLRYLAQKHRVTLVSFVRDDDRPEDIEHLLSFCDAVHTVPMRRSLLRNVRAALKAGLTGQSLIILRDEISAMFHLLRRLVAKEHFDVVHADQTSMVQYALFARNLKAAATSGHPPKVVLDAHNALYRIPERMAEHEGNPFLRVLYRREARALARFELSAYRQFNHVVFVTDVDRDLLQPQLAGSQPLNPRPDKQGTGLQQQKGPDLPFTTIRDLQESYPYDMFAVPLKEVVRIHTSSASAEHPIVMGYTSSDLHFWR